MGQPQALTLEPKRELRTRAARHRESIRVGMLITRLDDFVHDKVQLTAAQVNAARILINKVVPDATLPPGDQDPGQDPTGLSAAYLMGVIEGKSRRLEPGATPEEKAEKTKT